MFSKINGSIYKVKMLLILKHTSIQIFVEQIDIPIQLLFFQSINDI